ncbi:unnamed protein product [Callosobruchus maculatus]|uniref:Uncharacterized protein n=1 Tax=Callosobruchus maculatus TaxID=64391 RepID=A0A653BTA7_CALMS|nr:unnamed protein product [Callosobruchus maculatus]
METSSRFRRVQFFVALSDSSPLNTRLGIKSYNRRATPEGFLVVLNHRYTGKPLLYRGFYVGCRKLMCVGVPAHSMYILV